MVEFSNGTGWPDVVTAACATIALFFGCYTYYKQKSVSDVSSVLEIFNKTNEYWDKLNKLETKSDNDEEFRYFLGHILSQFEIACHMYTAGAISRLASDIIMPYVKEIWEKLNEIEYYKSIIDSLISSDTTLEHINLAVKKFDCCRAERFKFYREQF